MIAFVDSNWDDHMWRYVGAKERSAREQVVEANADEGEGSGNDGFADSRTYQISYHSK